MDGSPPDGTPDKALATVSREGQPAENGTLVTFKLNDTSATFSKDTPNVQTFGRNLIIVATSGGTAEAWFVDGKSSGDTATLTASLMDHSEVPSIPPSLPFTFKAAAQDYKLTFTDPLANNQVAGGGTPNEGQAVVTDGDCALKAPVVVKFEFTSPSSAQFVLTGNPYIQSGSSPTTLLVKTHNENGKDIVHASFTDVTAEPVTLKALLQSDPNVKDTQDFAFTLRGDWAMTLGPNIPWSTRLPASQAVYVTYKNGLAPLGTKIRFTMGLGVSAFFDVSVMDNVVDHGTDETGARYVTQTVKKILDW